MGAEHHRRMAVRPQVHPNILTLIGLVINIFAAVLFAKGLFFWAGLVVVFAGIFDMVDGEVARRTGRVTKFGAFFDSVIDRYSDMVLLLGLVVWYAKIDSCSTWASPSLPSSAPS